MPQIIEGSWEEVIQHAPMLRGKRVRLVVLETENDATSSEEPRPPAEHPLDQIVGIAKGGEKDLSENHDYYLYLCHEK